MMLRLPRFAAVLSAACLLLASCSKDDTPPAPHVRPEVADRTVMMFLGGNNNLLSNFMANVKDASRFVSAHTLNDCRLLAFIQPRTNLAAVLELSYDYERGGCVIDTLRKWQDAAFCSADGERISEVLGYMAQEAPAKAYGLIMGSHGTGLVPSQYMTLSSLRSPDADFWKKADGAYETRWFGSDKERSTDITTLSSCLTALRSEGVKFDYLIFDACFMGNIETFYELRGCADYLLGSPCEIMSHGFPYEQAMPYLFADEGKSFDLAGVCRSYVAFYDTEYSVRSACITMAVSSELDALAATMKRVNAGAVKSYNRNSLQRYEGLSSPLFIDLGDYVEAMCDDPALLADFYQQMERTFPTRYHTPQYYSAYDKQMHDISVPDDRWYGVTVSEPSLKYRTENQQTAWYQATH